LRGLNIEYYISYLTKGERTREKKKWEERKNRGKEEKGVMKM
jgi:hypothetical protein